MGKKNKQVSRNEYVDKDGWKVLEFTGPSFNTTFKVKDKQCIYIYNGRIIYQGPYTQFDELDCILELKNKRLESLIDDFVDKFVDDLFWDDDYDKNIIDMVEDRKTTGTYKYIPKEEKRNKRNNGCILPGCGGCLGGCCLLLLGTTVILWLLGETVQAIVQFIINLF